MASSGSDGRSAVLVGRERECVQIDRRLERAWRGESGSLVLRAEAGMGKTALLDYAADQAAGMATLRVTGVQAEYELAFAGLHGLAWPIVDRLPQLPEPQRRALSAALGLAPGEGRDRFLVSAGVLSLLAAAAEAGPLLCLVDDAQWLDVPSADALVFAARRLAAEGVVILFAAREGERRGFEAAGLEELILERLDRESGEVLLNRSSRAIASSVRARLLAEAAGNPLALLELPSRLSDTQLAGRETLPEALPLNAGLRAAFAQQITRLPEPTKHALLIAAAEETGDLGVILNAATELSLAADALDPAEEIGLVETDGATLTFRHPLVRSAVYESAPLGRRRSIHAALADVLLDEKSADRALWHRAMATMTPDEELAAALEESAHQSQRRGGHASAATAFERAAKLSSDEQARGTRLTLAAEAARMAGQADRARGLVNRSLPIADRAQSARLLYVRGHIEAETGWLQEGVRTLEKAAALSEDTSLTLEMLREASAMAMYANDYDEAVVLGRRAGELAATTEVDRFVGLVVSGYAADLAGEPGRGAVRLAKAMELADRLDDPSCLIWAAETAARQGTAGQQLAYGSQAVEIARERSLLSVLPFALQAQAAGLISHSRLDLAYSTATEGWRLALDIGQQWAAGWNLAHLALIDALRGAEQLARARAADLQALVTTSGATALTANISRALGLLELGLGRPAQALDRLLVVVSTVRPESNPLFVLGLPDALEAGVRADRLGDVSVHLARFEEWATAFPSPARLALLARCRALVDEAGAERHFSQAVELAHALSPFDRARSELLYGEWLRRHRRRVDARSHLRLALEVFGQLGVLPWEERARSELRASGETARKRDPSSRDQLTPQELQIARLVAEGMTNADVAARLFLSPRTIDYHLRKVFAKLEIASRTELASADLGEPVAA